MRWDGCRKLNGMGDVTCPPSRPRHRQSRVWERTGMVNRSLAHLYLLLLNFTLVHTCGSFTSAMSSFLRVPNPRNTVLLICDVQERLRESIDSLSQDTGLRASTGAACALTTCRGRRPWFRRYEWVHRQDDTSSQGGPCCRD
jgi:hypothetical protein